MNMKKLTEENKKNISAITQAKADKLNQTPMKDWEFEDYNYCINIIYRELGEKEITCEECKKDILGTYDLCQLRQKAIKGLIENNKKLDEIRKKYEKNEVEENGIEKREY